MIPSVIAYAELAGLAPVLIQVGTHEVLLDDSTRLAERAQAAGVDVTLEVWEHMIHVWQFFAAILPVCIGLLLAALLTHLELHLAPESWDNGRQVAHARNCSVFTGDRPST